MAPQYLSPGVYVEEVDRGAKPIEGVGTAVAGFVGFTAKGPISQPTFISSWSQFVSTFGEFMPGAYLAHAVYGYFHNGGGGCFVTRVGGAGAVEEAEPAAQAALPARSTPAVPTLRVLARESATAELVTVEVRPAEEGAEEQFTLVVRRGAQEETFPNVTLGRGRGARNVEDVVNRESQLVQVKVLEATGTLVERAPAPGTYPLAMPEATAVALRGEVTPAVFVGEAAARSGLSGLEVADEVTMVCAPDVMAAYQAGKIDLDGVKAIQQALLDHCAAMKDRFAILDCLPGMNPQQIKEWRMSTAGYDSKYGALYYPWIKVANPLANGDTLLIPPCGHLAGVYARSDTERGVHKAPANEVVRGAIGLEAQISKGEQDILNPVGINCLRAFPGRGLRVWGARTLSSDASWRYINVRRLFNFIEESIEQGTQWVVFEPNDRDLWERVKRDISAFLTRVWMDGALFGGTPDEAFYVKCDDELNPPEVRDAGQLIIEIGLAPVKPAEFVIFRISQFAGGASVNE